MNNRIGTVVVAVTLLSLMTGCSGMKNFMFGRGARCGLCTKVGSCLGTPCFGNTMQAPAPQYASAPQYAPSPQPYAAPQCAAPAYQAPTCQAPVCGCETAPTYAGESCGCGASSAAYGPAVDPYNNGVVYGDAISNAPSYGSPVYGSPMGEQRLGEQIIGERVIGNAPIQGDNWQSRKFDTDGHKILWEEPIPSGAQSL